MTIAPLKPATVWQKKTLRWPNCLYPPLLKRVSCPRFNKGDIMKKILTLTFLLATLLPTAAAYAGCTHPDDRASDGSRCGGRSSDSRPGGK
jgi:hypothetical protein